MNNFKPPLNISKRNFNKKYVFLAGTIENGNSIDWQSDLTSFFNDYDWGVFNPRRDDWNSKWIQSFENPEFQQQVNWELKSLDECDLIVMNFIPNTISPISLYEFGRYSKSNKMIVICPQGYFRKGNVEVGCFKDNIPLYDTIDEFKDFFIKNHQSLDHLFGKKA